MGWCRERECLCTEIPTSAEVFSSSSTSNSLKITSLMKLRLRKSRLFCRQDPKSKSQKARWWKKSTWTTMSPQEGRKAGEDGEAKLIKRMMMTTTMVPAEVPACNAPVNRTKRFHLSRFPSKFGMITKVYIIHVKQT